MLTKEENAKCNLDRNTSDRQTDTQQFLKCAKHSLFFVYFPPFLNTMTNIVQNLTLTGRSIDGVLGIRTQDRKLVGATNPLGYGGPLRQTTV